MDDEIWKDIPGYEGLYQASNAGRIRSLRVLKPVITAGTGYPRVNLHGHERFAVHTLIARTFIGPQRIGLVVNHKDSNRTNNLPTNLEYVTPSENVRHSYREGNKKLYFTNEQMDRIALDFFHDGRSIADIARVYLPEDYSIQDYRGMRKRVLSVIETWRSHQRPTRKWKGPHQFKLTYDKAEQMRTLRKAGAKQADLARLFHCHPAHVSRVLARQMWAAPEKISTDK